MLTGTQCLLRPPRESDEDFLDALRNSVDTQLQLLARPRPNDRTRLRDWIRKRLSDEACVFFIIEDTDDGGPAGFIQCNNMNTIDGHGELGIALAPAARGKGLATEAIGLLGGYLRDVFNLRKMTLHVLADNTPAIAAYRSCGFSDVGVLRSHYFSNGDWHDVLVMETMLRTP